MHNYKELKVWQNARTLVKDVYLLTEYFPENEKFGLTSQVRRCVISVSSNIAEGCGRGSDRDFTKFLNISLGSAYELESQIILAYDLGFINEKIFKDTEDKIQAIQKMLYSLHKKFAPAPNLMSNV